MKLEWDERKRVANWRKHGLDFALARELFNAEPLRVPDTQEDYGEERWIAIGQIKGRVVTAAFVERGADTIRILSLRKASRKEKQTYYSHFPDRLGPD